MLTRNRA